MPIDGECPFAEQIRGLRQTTATQQGVWSEGYVDRVGWCDHTAGGYYSTLRSASFWNEKGVSTHFAISQKGEICQMVNIFDTAYAQGSLGPVVSWPPYAEMGRGNPNGYLISTEHEDKTVTNYVWSPEMYAADLKLKQWCVEEVKRVTGKDMLRFDIDSLAGHHMFDSVNRKYCPGTGWPREKLYKDLRGGDLANLNGDGSMRIVEENGCMVFYIQNIPVFRIGDAQGGPYVGQLAKNFGGQFIFLRNPGDADGKAEAYWSPEPGD